MRDKLRSLHALHCPFQINHRALERVTSVILTPPDLNLIDMYFLVHFIFLLYSYYSDPSRKYLVVELPPTLSDKKGQKEVLLSSFELAYVLNRTLILPAFNCPNTVTKHCNYQTRFPRTPFYLDIIEGKYREHMFLQHPKVPNAVKFSQSQKVNFKKLIRGYARNIFGDQDKDILRKYLNEYSTFAVLNIKDFHLIKINTQSGIRETLAKI